ncbi:hypothetical protein D3C87_2174820 [compost metagenome]
MAAMPTALLEFCHARVKVQFVMSHEDLLGRNAIKGRHRRHGFTAQVHKGGRYQKAHILTANV